MTYLKYELGPTSSTAVTLNPNYDIDINNEQNRADHRSIDGTLYQYKYHSFRSFDISLEWVPATDASIINSWFDTNTDLTFFISSGTSVNSYEVYSVDVRILNNSSPMNNFQAPYVEYYAGALKLESIAGV